MMLVGMDGGTISVNPRDDPETLQMEWPNRGERNLVSRPTMHESDERAWPALFYESTEISHARIEWCDLETQSYPQQAKMFVKKIWPKFVEAMKARLQNENPVVA